MNIVDVHSVKVEGFRSFVESETFSLDRPGINMIKGKNGSGKSTLLETIVWAWYNENLKGTTKDKIPSKEKYRGPNFRGTRVILTFSINGKSHLIARHINFKGDTLSLKGDNKVMLFEDIEGTWGLRSEDLYNGDIQDHIERLLGIDYNTFLNSIVFGQKMKRLVESKPSEKRDIFEKLFDLGFVEAAKTKAKEKKDKATTLLNKSNILLSSLESTLSNNLTKLEADTKLVNSFESDKKIAIQTLKNSIDKYEKEDLETGNHKSAKLLEITKQQSKLDLIIIPKEDDLKISIESLETERTRNNDEKEKLEKLKKDLSIEENDLCKEIKKSEAIIDKLKLDIENINTNCPTCEQKLPKGNIQSSKDKLKEQIEKEKTIIKVHEARLIVLLKDLHNIPDELLKNSKGVKDRELKLSDSKLKLSNINNLKITESNLIQTLKDLNRDVSDYDKDLSRNKTSIENLTIDIETTKNKKLDINLDDTRTLIDGCKDNIDEVQTKIQTLTLILEKVNWWISKGFGSSGVKSYVFFAMLTQLNQSILKYCDRLGVLVQFSVDITKASKPFITTCFKDDGTEITYNELSGGERARIDLATCFAVYDLIANSKTKFNCLFLDETFAGLDEEGLYEAFDLLRSISEQGKSIYVITHNQNVDLLNTKTINIEKINGVSKII